MLRLIKEERDFVNKANCWCCRIVGIPLKVASCNLLAQEARAGVTVMYRVMIKNSRLLKVE